MFSKLVLITSLIMAAWSSHAYSQTPETLKVEIEGFEDYSQAPAQGMSMQVIVFNLKKDKFYQEIVLPQSTKKDAPYMGGLFCSMMDPNHLAGKGSFVIAVGDRPLMFQFSSYKQCDVVSKKLQTEEVARKLIRKKNQNVIVTLNLDNATVQSVEFSKVHPKSVPTHSQSLTEKKPVPVEETFASGSKDPEAMSAR